jgi:hypothetical protein
MVLILPPPTVGQGLAAIGTCSYCLALARQRKSQVTRYFTTQMLHYHKLESDSGDYKLEQVRVFHLPSLFIVLTGFLELQSADILGSTLRLISQYF